MSYIITDDMIVRTMGGIIIIWGLMIASLSKGKKNPRPQSKLTSDDMVFVHIIAGSAIVGLGLSILSFPSIILQR